MKRHKKVPLWRAPETEDIVDALKYRALERCAALGHALGYWSQAKRKKHGRGSQQAICAKCGEMVFISPYMEYTREHPQVPAIKGDALFQLCYKQGQLV